MSEPHNSVAPLGGWRNPYIGATPEGLRVDPYLMASSELRSPDLLVCACDADHTGAVTFEVAIEYLQGKGRANDCPTVKIVDLSSDAIEAAFSAMAPFSVAHAASAEYGRVKRYFDWNFNVNSFAVLGAAQRRAGVPDGPHPLSRVAPLLSKYALQLLYDLHARPPMPDGLVISLMHRWPGTGRYQVVPGEWRAQLGSPASRYPILDNLISAGLLARTQVDGKQGVLVSARGRTLLGLLHPDCEDPDLPFRLHAWCEQGAASKPAIDRYIKTFFGKQKRFLAHASDGATL